MNIIAYVHPLCPHSMELIRTMTKKGIPHTTKTVTRQNHPDFITGTPVLVVDEEVAYAGDRAFQMVSEMTAGNGGSATDAAQHPSSSKTPKLGPDPVGDDLFVAADFLGTKAKSGTLTDLYQPENFEMREVDNRPLEAIMKNGR